MCVVASSHSGMVLSWQVWCWLLALVSVKYVVCALDLSRLVSWQVVALCLAILRFLLNLCYIERVGGILSLFWHSVRFGLVYIVAKRGFSDGYPYIGQIKNSRNCIIWMSVVCMVFHKWLESLW